MTSRVDAIFGSLAEQLRLTPQPPQWHTEGDVYAHTLMVCRALGDLPEYRALPERLRELAMAAAWLHDIGKLPTTKVIAGAIEAPHHAPVGSRMARERLWLGGVCGTPELMARREALCQLIRYHSLPPHAIDAADAAMRLHRIAANGLLAGDFSIRLLCMLAKADMLGRICGDQPQMLDQIALCEELAAEEQCLDGCFAFPSAHTRRAYLSGRGVWKDQELYDDTWGPVYLMSGLPGTGKDTWISQNLPGLPMVSLDDIRRARKIDPAKNQGLIANLAKEMAKEHLRRREPFVWNATNITQAMRQQLISLMESYKARVTVIYLETDWQTLLQRNSSRQHAVPQAAIEAMLGKLEPPEAHEAAHVAWLAV